MLFKITTKCNMKCSHCLNSCDENGIDMEWNDVIASVKFINQINCHFLILTGGEPTEHKDFISILKYICSNTPNIIQIVIASNGLYFEKNPSIVNEILDYDKRVNIQITNDKRYYPIHIDKNNDIYKSKRVLFCETVEHMYPQGRAINFPHNSKCSKCFNFLAIPKQIRNNNLENIIQLLESRFKFCTPQIDADGTLKPGESSLCKSFGTIYDDGETLLNNILKFRCSQCDFINKNLPEQYQKLINMK